MQSKLSATWSVVILSIIGTGLFSMVIFSPTFALPSQGFYTKPSSPSNGQTSENLEQASSGLPIRLEIPKINVDAAIEYVGLTPQGAMGVPAGPTDAAWFDLGPRPGQSGSAVIAGHEGWKDNIPAIFDNLHQLQIGDKIYVEDENGSTTTFVVRAVQTYDQNADASAVFGSSDGKAHLNLITCEGVWNAAQKSYSDRLVVFTDEEAE